MIIIGIDPGTIITGYGILRIQDGDMYAIDYGCIRPPSSYKLSDRYLIIYNCLEEILASHAPDILVVETQFVHKNVQSAIKLGMARGIILLAAKRRGIQVYEYSPTKVKKAVTGQGRASKQQVQSMVASLLSLKALPEPEDAADALALALCHAHAIRFQTLLGIEI